jgi:hypothetical protein
LAAAFLAFALRLREADFRRAEEREVILFEPVVNQDGFAKTADEG